MSDREFAFIKKIVAKVDKAINEGEKTGESDWTGILLSGLEDILKSCRAQLNQIQKKAITMGGKPNPGTAPDKRLKENRPATKGKSRKPMQNQPKTQKKGG